MSRKLVLSPEDYRLKEDDLCFLEVPWIKLLCSAKMHPHRRAFKIEVAGDEDSHMVKGADNEPRFICYGLYLRITNRSPNREGRVFVKIPFAKKIRFDVDEKSFNDSFEFRWPQLPRGHAFTKQQFGISLITRYLFISRVFTPRVQLKRQQLSILIDEESVPDPVVDLNPIQLQWFRTQRLHAPRAQQRIKMNR
ncbi:MAG: hypothetical protein U0487_01515 [Patescibacteria group bacterium]